MKIWESFKRIIGASAFIAIVYMKVTGGDVDILWLAIPAVLMGISLEDITKAIQAWRK